MSTHHSPLVAIALVVGSCLPAMSLAATCTASVRYLGADAADAKGFKQSVRLGVSTGRAAHGLVNYTIEYRDKDGATQHKATNARYTFDPGTAPEVALADGTRIRELPLTDDAVLAAGHCADKQPCAVAGVNVDKVSCFVDR
jgi:hypothetical protein